MIFSCYPYLIPGYWNRTTENLKEEMSKIFRAVGDSGMDSRFGQNGPKYMCLPPPQKKKKKKKKINRDQQMTYAYVQKIVISFSTSQKSWTALREGVTHGIKQTTTKLLKLNYKKPTQGDTLHINLIRYRNLKSLVSRKCICSSFQRWLNQNILIIHSVGQNLDNEKSLM